MLDRLHRSTVWSLKDCGHLRHARQIIQVNTQVRQVRHVRHMLDRLDMFTSHVDMLGAASKFRKVASMQTNKFLKSCDFPHFLSIERSWICCTSCIGS